MANAGRVAIVPKGEYSDTVDYKRLDLVRFDNDLYIAKKANTGVAPTDSETWMLALENVSQTQYDDLINGTTPVAKAKDADTVDGYHASDFAKSEQFSTQGDFTWMQSKSGNLAYRLQVHSGEVQYWESTDGGANWAKKATLNKNYLPLTGGTLSGGLGVNGGLCTFYADGNHVGIMAKDVYLDDNNSRTLMLFNTQFAADDAECFQIWKRVGGAITPLTVLHTGNSNAVIKSTTAPSDTTAVWVDTTNKKVKAYIDGAWTAMAQKGKG